MKRIVSAVEKFSLKDFITRKSEVKNSVLEFSFLELVKSQTQSFNTITMFKTHPLHSVTSDIKTILRTELGKPFLVLNALDKIDLYLASKQVPLISTITTKDTTPSTVPSTIETPN